MIFESARRQHYLPTVLFIITKYTNVDPTTLNIDAELEQVELVNNVLFEYIGTSSEGRTIC